MQAIEWKVFGGKRLEGDYFDCMASGFRGKNALYKPAYCALRGTLPMRLTSLPISSISFLSALR
jgi:hypothetical protein